MKILPMLSMTEHGSRMVDYLTNWMLTVPREPIVVFGQIYLQKPRGYHLTDTGKISTHPCLKSELQIMVH